MLVLMFLRVLSRVSGFPVASPCLWGKLQNLSFSNVSKQVVMSFCVAGVALCDIPTCLITCRKCQNWRKSRTKCSFFLHPRVSSRVSGFPVASPCLWGKLQNLSFSKVSKQVVTSFCVAGVALCDIPTCLLTCRKCQNWRKSRTKCSFFLHPRVSSRVSGFPVASPCLWGKLRTPHSTLYTLHSTIYTLDSTLYTLHSTLCTLHSSLLTRDFTLHTPHSTLYTLHFTHYTPHSTLDILHSRLYTLHSSLHTLHFTLHTPHFTLHTPHFTLHTPHLTFYTPDFTLYTLHSTLYTLHSTLLTLHSTLLTLHSTLHT